MMRRKINSIRSIRSTPTERHRTCSLAEGRKCIDSGRCTRETVFNRMQIRASSSVGWTVHGTTGIGVGASFTEQPAFTITSHTRPFTIVRSLSLSLCLSVCLSLSLSLSPSHLSLLFTRAHGPRLLFISNSDASFGSLASFLCHCTFLWRPRRLRGSRSFSFHSTAFLVVSLSAESELNSAGTNIQSKSFVSKSEVDGPFSEVVESSVLLYLVFSHALSNAVRTTDRGEICRATTIESRKFSNLRFGDSRLERS